MNSAQPDERTRTGPPCLRVLGRAGVGKSILSAALSRRGIHCVSAGPADAVLYCFAGGLRDTDRNAIRALGVAPAPLVVAWTKADAAGSWGKADDYAAGLASIVGQPVLPVMALLDAVDRQLLPRVRDVAASSILLPERMTDAAACLGPNADLLAELGRYGLACALGAVRECPSLSDDELLAQLQSLGAVDVLLEPLAQAFAGMTERRDLEVLEALRRTAITEPARRDQAEQELLDRVARTA